MPQSQCQCEDIRHTEDSDHLSVVYIAGETEGRSFSEGTIQWLPAWVALVLCLACQIKQPFLLIGDLILYVTFLNFRLVLGFLMQEVECFSIQEERLY